MYIINNKEQFDDFVSNPRRYLRYAKRNMLSIEYDYSKEYEVLVNAVLMTNRKERIQYIYDSACDKIDEYNEKHNIICEFKDGRCQAKGGNGRLNGCCYHCRLQSETGCPTRNLTCKFYYCDMLKAKNPPKFDDFPEFRLLTHLQKNIVKTNAYCYKETYIKLLLANSYLLFYIYSVRNAFDMEMADLKNKRLDKSLLRRS